MDLAIVYLGPAFISMAPILTSALAVVETRA
jgi:hypothetical protein